jgi:cell wall-associated NlpC family hydrolase
MIGDQVAAQAEQWIGVPFKWQGTVRKGCDCKGLVAGVARELGLSEADSVEALAGDYSSVVNGARLRRGMARLFDPVPVADRHPGDLLLVKLDGKAQHLAICAPTERQPNRVIETLNVGPMQVRPFRRSPDEIDSVWRWRDVA